MHGTPYVREIAIGGIPLLLPTVVGLSLFFVLLPGEQSLPAFYCISLSILVTFALASHAFLAEDYRHKVVMVISLFGLLGMSPFILGEQYYHLIHDAVGSGNIVAGGINDPVLDGPYDCSRSKDFLKFYWSEIL